MTRALPAFIAELMAQGPAQPRQARPTVPIEVNAAAYRIWADCKANGWERTITEIAESTSIPSQRVMRIASVRNWMHRMRRSHRHNTKTPVIQSMDHELDRLGGSRAWGGAA